MRDVQRLMGCLLFSDRDPGDTPYADLLSPTRWEEVAQEFARQACSLMGQVGVKPKMYRRNSAICCEGIRGVAMAGLPGFAVSPQLPFVGLCCHSAECSTWVAYFHVPHTLGGSGAGVCAASLQPDGTGGNAIYTAPPYGGLTVNPATLEDSHSVTLGRASQSTRRLMTTFLQKRKLQASIRYSLCVLRRRINAGRGPKMLSRPCAS
jgi:hypothetical protein